MEHSKGVFFGAPRDDGCGAMVFRLKNKKITYRTVQ